MKESEYFKRYITKVFPAYRIFLDVIKKLHVAENISLTCSTEIVEYICSRIPYNGDIYLDITIREATRRFWE